MKTPNRASLPFGITLLSLVLGPVGLWANEVPLLPPDCEVELALQAAPEALRSEAGVYAWTKKGYEQVRGSTNGFNCIVNRDHPKSLKPTCFDAEGSETIVPKIVMWGSFLAAGEELTAISAKIDAAFESGELIRPRRAGVAYMLSGFNRPVNPASGASRSFPPHVMFYAPDLTGDDIGFTHAGSQANPALPFIAYQGPHGYMVVITGAGDGVDIGEPPSCKGGLTK